MENRRRAYVIGFHQFEALGIDGRIESAVVNLATRQLFLYTYDDDDADIIPDTAEPTIEQGAPTP